MTKIVNQIVTKALSENVLSAENRQCVHVYVKEPRRCMCNQTHPVSSYCRYDILDSQFTC
jgi:hypothetical protein